MVLESHFQSTFIAYRYINVILCPPSPIYYLFVQQIPGGRDWHVYLVVTYALLFLATLVYINATFSERLKEEVLLQKDRQMSDLAHYSQQIEQLYTDLRRFRHDYLNILSSIKYGIDSKDIAIISDIYDNILEKQRLGLRETVRNCQLD